MILFGSTARDEAGPESHVDILVEFAARSVTLLSPVSVRTLSNFSGVGSIWSPPALSQIPSGSGSSRRPCVPHERWEDRVQIFSRQFKGFSATLPDSPSKHSPRTRRR